MLHSLLFQFAKRHSLPSFCYCLRINRCDSASASTQLYSSDFIDSFSREDLCACFEDMHAFETFIDATKRCCASAAQVLSYIDSLPLPPRRDKGALGSKG